MTPPIGARRLIGTASNRAMVASQTVECVRLQVTQDTATVWTKKLSHDTIAPTEKRRKLATPNASPIPPSANAHLDRAESKRGG